MKLEQQQKLLCLFRDLAKVRGWKGAQADEERKRITRELFGAELSWSATKNEMNNSHVDRLVKRLIALADETNVPAQIADANSAEDGERARLIYRIEADLRRAGFSEGYVIAISRDQFDQAAWRELEIGPLTNLRDTLANRVQAKRKKAAKADAEPDDNIPF